MPLLRKAEKMLHVTASVITGRTFREENSRKKMLVLLTQSEGYSFKSFHWIAFLCTMQEKPAILNILNISVPVFKLQKAKVKKPSNIWKKILEQWFSNLYWLQVKAWWAFNRHLTVVEAVALNCTGHNTAKMVTRKNRVNITDLFLKWAENLWSN